MIDCLLAPGKKIAFNGETLTFPDIKMAIFSAANPFHAQQDRNRMIEAWKKLETVVVLDHQWTASCRFADIVLPVTTRFERNDIERFGTHSNKGLMAIHQVVKPQFEARHDFDVFAGLCKRFGQEEAYREKRDEMQWIKAIYDEGAKTGASLGVSMPNFESFWQGEGYIEYPAGKPWVRHGEFREQPDINPLGTPSGLIEIYSKTIAGFAYEDCPGHPVWMEPFERTHGSKTDKYPLHLQSCHPDKRLHSQLCSSEAFRNTYAVAGREPLYMSESDARARGLKAGDIARVFNARGGTGRGGDQSGLRAWRRPDSRRRVVFAAGRWESGHTMHLWRSECAECGYRYITTGAGAFGAYGAGRGGAVPGECPAGHGLWRAGGCERGGGKCSIIIFIDSGRRCTSGFRNCCSASWTRSNSSAWKVGKAESGWRR